MKARTEFPLKKWEDPDSSIRTSGNDSSSPAWPVFWCESFSHTQEHFVPTSCVLLFLPIISRDVTWVLLWKATPRALHTPALGSSGGPALNSAENQLLPACLVGTKAGRRCGCSCTMRQQRAAGAADPTSGVNLRPLERKGP